MNAYGITNYADHLLEFVAEGDYAKGKPWRESQKALAQMFTDLGTRAINGTILIYICFESAS